MRVLCSGPFGVPSVRLDHRIFFARAVVLHLGLTGRPPAPPLEWGLRGRLKACPAHLTCFSLQLVWCNFTTGGAFFFPCFGAGLQRRILWMEGYEKEFQPNKKGTQVDPLDDLPDRSVREGSCRRYQDSGTVPRTGR